MSRVGFLLSGLFRAPVAPRVCPARPPEVPCRAPRLSAAPAHCFRPSRVVCAGSTPLTATGPLESGRGTPRPPSPASALSTTWRISSPTSRCRMHASIPDMSGSPTVDPASRSSGCSASGVSSGSGTRVGTGPCSTWGGDRIFVSRSLNVTPARQRREGSSAMTRKVRTPHATGAAALAQQPDCSLRALTVRKRVPTLPSPL